MRMTAFRLYVMIRLESSWIHLLLVLISKFYIVITVKSGIVEFNINLTISTGLRHRIKSPLKKKINIRK